MLASAGLFLVLTGSGIAFVLSHKNELARSILEGHTATVVGVYLRIGLGYVLAGLLAAFLLHPFLPGKKVMLGLLGLAVLGFVHTLTDETHLLFGPTQTLFCTVHDAIPGWIRGLYHPAVIEVLVGAVALAGLVRWARRLPPRGRVAAAGVAAAAAAVAFWPASAGAATPAASPRPCFVLIATDSLRADHLGCNGYARDTSPHIDALAARGTNFANCLVPTASTHESWISMFSSTSPRENGLRHMFPSREKVARIERAHTFLPEVLKERGYATAAIGGWCGTTFGVFDVGFDHVDVSNTQNHVAFIAEAAFHNHLLAAAFLDNPLGRLLLPELDRVSFTRAAGAITQKAEAWIDAQAGTDEPFFLTLVYHVTHLPYSASYPYYAQFTDPAYRGRNRYRIDFQIDEMIQRGFDHDLSEAETQHIVDLYDGCVREFDDQVGAIVAHLEKRGLLDRTIVGVLADHGDDLYEHGTTLGHGVTLFGGDQANRVPAVFAGPGVPVRAEPKLVRSTDLAPTWLRWLGLADARPEGWRGLDLEPPVPDLTALLETSYLLYRQPVPDLRPGEVVKQFPKFDRATFLDPDFDHNVVLREELEDEVVATKCFAVRQGDWKLISVPGENGPILRLFDLAGDPQCRADLKEKRPAVVARLKEHLPESAR